MVEMGEKFCFAPRKMLVVTSAVLISLSVASADEPRKCHWCGPLAEQVHRSQRAPSCDALEKHITICDPGYSYCAVVVTSPPHIESRYCVKLYQDECYSIFCNSTKTWRMTCPCRGDLCNGIHTERETLAFQALLPNLVAKTHSSRIKKRTVLYPKPFISTRSRTPPPNEAILSNDTNNETIYNDSIAVDELESHGILKEEIANIESKNNTTDIEQEQNDEVSKTIDDNDNKVNEIESTTSINNVKFVQNEMATTEATKATEMSMITEALMQTTEKDKSIISNEIKPSEVLPTAEALQQNVSPVDSNEKQEQDVEETTTKSTPTELVTSPSQINVTHKPPRTNKNNGIRILSNYFTIIAIFIIKVNI